MSFPPYSINPSRWQSQERYKRWGSRLSLLIAGASTSHYEGYVYGEYWRVEVTLQKNLPGLTYHYHIQKQRKKWKFSWINERNLKIQNIWNDEVIWFRCCIGLSLSYNILICEKLFTPLIKTCITSDNMWFNWCRYKAEGLSHRIFWQNIYIPQN